MNAPKQDNSHAQRGASLVASTGGFDSLEHLCATVYMGRNWHGLSHNEREIVPVSKRVAT